MHPQDRQFIDAQLPPVQGWLIDDAAHLTSALMRAQEQAGIGGGVFEIGVFAGKYLLLLFHLSQQTGEPVLGLDTFQWTPQSAVEENFARVFGASPRLRLWAADSTAVKPRDVLRKLGGRPRFISVDGAHTAAAVLSDIKLCEKLLGEGGVVAIDDFLNSRAIGVSEGAYRYFLSRHGRGLLPLVYCGNKLFVCRRRDLPRYRQAIERWLGDNRDLAVAANFQQMLAKGRNWVEQELLGVPVLIL